MNRSSWLAIVGAFLVVAVAASGLWLTHAPGPIRRIIIIDVDTLRGDYLGCAGGPVETPNLDALAAMGVRFSRARSHVPITLPSHSSLFTGQLPSDHGVLNNGQKLDGIFETLGEISDARGMNTAAFISLGVLKGKYGLEQGFQFYDQQLRKNSGSRAAGDVTDEVLTWVDSVADDQSVLLWVHYSDPHAPYAAPGGDYARFTVSMGGEAAGTVVADGWSQTFKGHATNGKCTVSLTSPPGTTVPPGGFRIRDFRTIPRTGKVILRRGMIEAPWPRTYILRRLPAQFDIVFEDREDNGWGGRRRLRMS